MHTKALSRLAVTGALVFAIGACGDSGSGGPEFDGEATTDETWTAAEDAAEAFGDAMHALNFGDPDIEILAAASASAERLAARHPEFGGRFFAQARAQGFRAPGLTTTRDGIQLVAAPGCRVEASGTDGGPFDPYDGNDNGIPDDWHVKIVCVQQDSTDPGNVETVTQTQEIAVKENTDALHGFSARALLSIRGVQEDGNSGELRVEATQALAIKADGVDEDHTFKARLASTAEGDAFESQGGEERHVSFDPASPIALGSDLPDGDLTIDGRQWFANTDDVSLSFSIETTDPMAYDAACLGVTHPPFTDGTIVGRLNGNSNSARFQVDFTACGDYTIEVDNTSDEGIPVTRKYVDGVALRQD
jgi:hypothetical protein